VRGLHAGRLDGRIQSSETEWRALDLHRLARKCGSAIHFPRRCSVHMGEASADLSCRIFGGLRSAAISGSEPYQVAGRMCAHSSGKKSHLEPGTDVLRSSCSRVGAPLA